MYSTAKKAPEMAQTIIETPASSATGRYLSAQAVIHYVYQLSPSRPGGPRVLDNDPAFRRAINQANDAMQREEGRNLLLGESAEVTVDGKRYEVSR